MSSKQKNDPIHFQAVSWSAKDIELEDSDDEDDYTSNKQYTITIFGRSFDGKSVCVKTAFNPFFYIEVPNNWKHSNALFLVKELRKKLGKRYGSHLLEYSLQKSKKFFGFTNHEEFNFLKVTFKSKIAWQYCGKTLKKPVYVLGKMERFNTYESNLDPMIRFAHIQEIPFSCSIRLDTYSVVPDDDERYSNCDIEVTAKWNTIKPSEEYDMIAPIIQASFDIETYSPDGSFPDPRNPKCPVLQIANTYQVYGQETIEKQLFCVGECEPIEGAEIIECEDERELLNRWALEVNRRQIDTITGYNIWKFDLEYMYVRAEYSGAHDFMNIGKVRDYVATLRDASFSSSAYGDNHYKMVDTPGILQIDLLVIMQREHKLVSYKLDNVAEHFLGERKVDLPYQVMFEKIVGTPADKREVGVYCIQDTELPQKLINKLAIIPNMVEMSKATWVPLSFLVERGQGIKVFSQLTYQTRLENMLVINLDKEEIKNDDYEGATVLAAKKGAYMEIPITGLDFASLYPTIMRAHNLDHSTLVMDPKYDNLEGVEYFQVNNHRFAQNHEGIIPKMLKLLAQNRKKAKKEMAKAEERGDTFAKALYNGKQLAFKVSMNSMYGFCGANVGMLPCKPVAESTTCVGRNMIEKTKNLVEEWYPGSDVVYGDSVMPYTPVLVKQGTEMKVKTIESLSNSWEEYPGFVKDGTDKEKSDLQDTYTWTHDGWKKITRVIRHKCVKKIYRVVTHTGVVDVTEDHSLLDKDLQLLKPGEVEVGKQLFQSFPEIAVSNKDINYKKLFVMGMFIGDGSCGFYNCPSGVKYSWAINNKDKKLLEKCKGYLEEMYEQYTFKILDTIDSSNVYKLVVQGKVSEFVTEWRDTCYDGKAKIIPTFSFGQSGLLDGLWAADGCRQDYDKIGCKRIDTKNQLSAQSYYSYLKSLGYNVSINTRDDKPGIFRLTFHNNEFRKECNAVKKVSVLHESWNDFVYDIETEAGTFQAGVGDIIVKNTDSVMVRFNVGKLKGKDAIQKCFELGNEAADRISNTFKKPIELEFEKVYFPYLLYSKKRYAGLMYTKPEKPDYIDAKGIQLVRRDNPPFVKDISQRVLDRIMYDMDVYGAMDLVRDVARTLLDNKIDVKDLIVSKSMKDNYKNRNQPHLAVAQKIEERAPGSGPKSGERVPYVFIDTGNKKHKQFEKAEDPEYAIEKKLPLDLMYYFEHSLSSPITSLFEVFIENTQNELFGEIIREYVNNKNKQRKLNDFFK